MLGLCLLGPSAWAASAGKVMFTKGVATAQVRGEAVRFLARGSEVGAGDVVSTAKRSYALLELADGTSMTLRPESVFELKSFDADEDNGSALAKLFKGGLRAVTGFISKKNPGAFKLETSVATIGIRGTEFEVRLCEEDCAGEADAARGEVTRGEPVAARVVFVKGLATAKGEAQGGKLRRLKLGASLYAGDAVETQLLSLAVLAMPDETRLTLQAETEFHIEGYAFAKAEEPAESNSALLRLVKGGLRAVTGLVAKRNRSGFKLETPAATIGIRGTGFDVICVGTCVEAAATSEGILERLFAGLVPAVMAQTGLPGSNGAVVSVWERVGGQIVLEFPGGDLVISAGETVFIPNDASAPIPLPAIPVELIQLQGPRPDQPESTAPGQEHPFGAPAGSLVIYVTEGELTVQGTAAGSEEETVGANENAVVGGVGEPVVFIPAALTIPTLDPAVLNSIFPLQDPADGGLLQDDFQCTLR